MNRSYMGDSAKMLKVSHFVRSRLASQQTAPADHLDPDMLVAFAEQRLSGGERANTLMHLAQCPECREVLALTSAVDPEEFVGASGPTRHSFAWWAWRCAAATILACLMVALTWRTPFIQHAPLSPGPKAPVTVPPPQIASVPRVTDEGAPESRRTKKRTLAERPASHPQNNSAEPNRMLSRSERAAASQETGAALLPGMLARPTSPIAPGANSMFQGESRTDPGRLVIAATGAQKPASLWRLSSDQGTVEKSHDGGTTWQPIRLDEGTPFYALSAIGPDIWVGGEDGTLYHSADDGLHWKKVLIEGDDNSRASGPITRIESHGRYVIRVATRSGDHWKTTDGGLRWQQE